MSIREGYNEGFIDIFAKLDEAFLCSSRKCWIRQNKMEACKMNEEKQRNNKSFV